MAVDGDERAIVVQVGLQPPTHTKTDELFTDRGDGGTLELTSRMKVNTTQPDRMAVCGAAC
jgi:hypothetical protein